MLFHRLRLAEISLKPVFQRQVPGVMPLFRKTDWSCFKAYAKEQCEELIKDHPSRTVEEFWSSFKRVIQNGMAKFVPKQTLVQRKVSRGLIRKRNDLFHTRKSPKSTRDRQHFSKVRQLVKTIIRQSYDRNIEDVLGNSTPDPNDQNTDTTYHDPGEYPPLSFSPKKLFSLIKKLSTGLPRHGPTQGSHYRHANLGHQRKANIENQELERPLRKRHHSHSANFQRSPSTTGSKMESLIITQSQQTYTIKFQLRPISLLL